MESSSLLKQHFSTHKSIFRADQLSKLRKRGLYEVWYTMFNNTGTKQGFWIRYTLLIPSTSVASKVSGTATIWFGYSNLNTPSKNFIVKKFFPLDEVQGSSGKEDDTIVAIGSSVLKLTG